MKSSARSTKASAAVERLKKRSANEHYSMSMSNGAMFSLVLVNVEGESAKLCQPMMMEEFVAFVNAYGPQTPKRVSKLDVEFSRQLTKKQLD